MRIALLSDIHGNAPALRAVLEDVKAEKIDALWFLGDVLGYGPLPITCINMLDEWSPAVWLMGNHDLGTLLVWEGVDIDDTAIHQMAPGIQERQVFKWHAVQLQVGLPHERVRQLREAPTWQRETNEVYAAHGAILSTDHNDIVNIGSTAYCHPWSPATESMLDTILQLDNEVLPRLIVVGHTHRPSFGQAQQWEKPRYWEWEESTEIYEDRNGLRILPEFKDCPVIICPGSVGHPRYVGGDNRAAYVIADLEDETLHFKRIDYAEGELKAAMVFPAKLESSNSHLW